MKILYKPMCTAKTQPLKIYLDKEQHLLLKILCALEQRSMNSVITELIADWIEEKKEVHKNIINM